MARRIDWLLIALLALGLAPGGVVGAAAFIGDPSGASLGMNTGYLAKLPFLRDFFWPGVALLVGMVIAPLVAAVAVWRRPPWGRLLALAVGVSLIGWIGLQAWMFGLAAPIQFAMLVMGLAITATAGLALRSGGASR